MTRYPFKDAGECLRHERESRGISLRKLADMVSLSPTFISQVERGESRPSVHFAVKIADVLGLSLTVRLRLRRVWEQPDRHEFERWMEL